MWFGANNGGVSAYDGTAWISLDTRDGLAGNTVTSICQDEEGNLWFGTLGEGVTRYQKDYLSPRARIVAVITDQRYTDLDALKPAIERMRITFEYTSIDFKTHPDKRLYRYKLENYDDDWSQPTTETEVDYTDLKSGEYTFHVQAIDRDLNYSEPATVNLTVKPHPNSVELASYKIEVDRLLQNLIMELNHKIKNELGGIISAAEYLRLGRPSLKELDDKTSSIIATSRQIAGFVSRMNHALRTGNLGAIAHSSNLSVQNLSSLVDSVIAKIRPRALVANIEIDWKKPESPPILECHEESLREAIRNLIINALEAMPNGGKITIRIEQTATEIRLRIRDTGHGISPDIQDRIFEPFFTRKTNGIGMGLDQVKVAIEYIHRGKINVESEVGVGTEFAIIIPLKDVSS
jgi:signal transduction histidine kinase